MATQVNFVSVPGLALASPGLATVASLEDVIASKEAAGRPKDVAQLPMLRDTLKVRRALDESAGQR